MGVDRKYLEKHGNQWRVQVPVPKALRGVIGKAKLLQPLGTDSLAIANREKHQHVHAFKQKIAAAEVEARRRAKLPSEDPMISEGMEWRAALLAEEGLAKDHEDMGNVLYALDVRVDEVTRRHGEKAAAKLSVIATGVGTPLSAHVAAWLAESGYTKGTADDHERAINRLKSWGKSTIEEIDRKAAGAFVTWMMNHRGSNWSGDRKTVKKYLSSLSAYWKWMGAKGHLADDLNPWLQQAPRKRAVAVEGDESAERAFTDEEVVKLLSGDADETLMDLMRLGALTGARLDVIVSLRVKDCANGCFRFKPQKKEPKARYVPIHSALKEIVERRTKGKDQEAYLFEVETSKEAGRERSMALSKRFGRYLRAQKVAVLIEGKRRSLVNFHSFRRYFSTKAEQAGQPEHIVAAVVGHKRPGMTFGLYSMGPHIEQARACVESVKLPPLRG